MIDKLEVIYCLTAPDTNKHQKHTDFGFDFYKFLRMLGIQTWIVKERLVEYKNKQTKKSSYFKSPLTLFLKAAYVQVQQHSFCLSIRNYSNQIVHHSVVEHCGDTLKLYNVSLCHLEVEYILQSCKTRLKYVCSSSIVGISIFSIKPQACLCFYFLINQ